MKVICINDRVLTASWIPLKFGNIYEPISEMKDLDGEDCYHIHIDGIATMARKGLNTKELYLKHRFIPLSSIDETEFIREYNTQTV